MAMIKCIKVAVNEEPKVVEIDNGLKSLQKEVNGYIETWMPTLGNLSWTLIVNEEGKLTLRNKPNRNIVNENENIIETLYGDFLIVGLDYNGFTSLKETEIKDYLNCFNKYFKKA